MAARKRPRKISRKPATASRKPAAAARKLLVTVSLSSEAVALVDALAARDGLSRSAWIEQRIRQAAREEGVEAPRRH
jgi:hypothetical protein